MDNWSRLAPDQLIDYVANGRPPTVDELMDLAERMWVEGGPHRSAFAWGQLQPYSSERVLALRSAALALNGSDS